MSNDLPGIMGLLEQLDKRILVVLQDGRHLIGKLRCFDQYSNVVMEDTHERHVVEDVYGDIPLGLYIVRGDNVVLMGEVDEDVESSENYLRKVSPEEILELEREKESTTKSDWDFSSKGLL
mmetsp:Transcript_1411/g.1920  ORF Transcript_1411/g.1920 Transcript_1411/m.1920 type:complete len:121 (+) Transcript_1411:179-541(+)|eukprot:CAMPEP_0117746138 /NCGR_PEP_ID=MMETSP0947-20121206/7774_1 /TAXON_ID=44440 /ORGANISM="Chattonella subsalsa, Strain CCMP2191" /LENGTH=120 /DNA_ID=CAMNT_0005563417 /DNA_START=177 /DNA_END=539 /DNA_ORIENTATION=+